MSKTYSVIAFVAGAAIGSAVTWYFAKTKYENLAREEIESVKEVFSKRRASDTVDISDEPKIETSEQRSSIEKNEEIVDVMGYSKKLQENDYVDYSAPRPVVQDTVERPYIITPDEFGELAGYSTIDLTYYADGVLTDDLDELVEDVENTVGSESLTHFGEYEDDSVFVRNDRLMADYEILLDTRNYSDVFGARSHL